MQVCMWMFITQACKHDCTDWDTIWYMNIICGWDLYILFPNSMPSYGKIWVIWRAKGGRVVALQYCTGRKTNWIKSVIHWRQQCSHVSLIWSSEDENGSMPSANASKLKVKCWQLSLVRPTLLVHTVLSNVASEAPSAMEVL